MTRWNTYTHPPANGAKAEKIVVMLHGVGSNGQDLIGLAPYFERVAPGVVFVSPDAPYPYDMLPPYMSGGYQWFSLQDRSPAAMLAGAAQAHSLLSSFLDDQLAQYGLKDSDMVLLGFSQGTMMSLYTGLRRANPPAGVLGYSGMLLGAHELSGPDIKKCPVQLIHGAADDVVPITAYHQSMTALQGAGFDVDGLAVPGLTHSIDASGIEAGAAFLKKVFKI